jgi:hypothetical protein
VLPSVDAQQRDVVARHGVLVGAGDDLESAGRFVLRQPGPAAALDAGQGGVDLALQSLEGSEVAVDGSLNELEI